jgi:uncharacterized protein (TIGR02678 family)
MLENDITKYIEGNLHIHKNSAMILLPNGSYRDVFPNNKNISDIILQMCYLIRNELPEDYINILTDGKMDIPLEKFQELIKRCRELYYDGWSKNFREMSANKLIDEVIFEMKNFQMIEVNKINDRVYILPLAGKFTGKYPKDYKGRSEEDVKMENE